MRRRDFVAGSTLAALSGIGGMALHPGGFSPVGAAWAQSSGVKPPTEHTKAANKKMLDALPFGDRRDFENARRGFIAGLPDGVIKNAQGKVVCCEPAL